MALCLSEASQRQAPCIAFPAMGTGQLGYPAREVAHAMFSAVETFASRNPSHCLKEVKIVIYERDVQVYQVCGTTTSASL
jgi:poly [ADP-ribose] polymerase 10/14/15